MWIESHPKFTLQELYKALNIGGWNTYGRLREEISNSFLDLSSINEA
jgi:hypothetical protein